ncbi:aminoacyl-tRNA hydrolase [Hippea maritima]|uniref:Peptidyl-tRNA hydrolase n=1 Tax=Hippea maritima (strain ATCC 700847 / DSM 10411 / MH2) TaxID=760142 RepID=F2LWG7_HIPMA|nr:aminoacyl-tRNA hydrolase [Hippea maritima]AEA34076.1 Peptidyl-tRNA hydrolase [Hippea maritima DSM 10411]
MDWLVVGLGNPGKEYALTPHNVGFMVCDSLSFLFDFDFTLKNKFKGFFGEFSLGSYKVGVLKPITYMNLSGISVGEVFSFYKIPLNRLIVIHDDVDLPLGRIKIKKNSSSGGHKGVESIIQTLSSKDFARVKIGVGREGNVRDYVLRNFKENELEIVNQAVRLSADAVVCIIKEGLNKAMNEYNSLNREVIKQ